MKIPEFQPNCVYGIEHGDVIAYNDVGFKYAGEGVAIWSLVGDGRERWIKMKDRT